MVAPEICGSDKYGEERERREIVNFGLALSVSPYQISGLLNEPI